MKRREFITLLGGAAAAWPLAAGAQQADPMRRIGALMNLSEGDGEGRQRMAELRQGLTKAGWVEGRNLQIDERWSAGVWDRTEAFAKELVELQPDVIVCVGTPQTAALLKRTHTVPIVFINLTDPVGQGLVQSLAKPGGNATGFTNFEFVMAAKWLELLKEIAPRVTRVSVIFNPATAPYFPLFLRPIEVAAGPLGVAVTTVQIRSVAEMESTVAALGRDSGVGLLIPTDSFTSINRARLIELAAIHNVPASYSYRYFVADGGLLSYGVDVLDLFQKAAAYVDRILRGEKPADLPVQQPTRFELAINLRTAKALRLDVPAALLARADEVIE